MKDLDRVPAPPAAVDIVLRLMNETGRLPLEIAWFYRKLTDRGLPHEEVVRETERAARAPGPMTLPDPSAD